MRQYELVEQVKSYDPACDELLLDRAYVYAMKAHGAQVRASGDPYFSHPVEVAGILTALKLDTATIATALLHDTVEDTGATLDDIERLFGKEIRFLVDGVTKLNKLELQSARTAQAENFRKLLLAMSDDIRVLMVKLADRLHNMRTLHFIKKEDKRRRIALETIEIYAPLAERIGMSKMKDELEDLAFTELFPDARESVVARLAQLRQHDHDLIDRIVDALRTPLIEAGLDVEVYGREKTPVSIWRKMQRKNVSFEQLSDIMAFRVIVDSVANCYAALGVIHGRFVMRPGRFKDFISTPKPNGYRSLHTTIIGPEQRTVEVQIRTRDMHDVAELGVAAHWAYKRGAAGPAQHEGRQYRWIRELLDILEHASNPEEFLEHTKLEMFQDQVFCFSPKGDLIALPRGATPVDFAYAVHSEVGDRCVGAKVDGRMVTLRTPLQNGNQVEILTSKNGKPSPEWERFVVTGKARARIRRHIRLQRREINVSRGSDILTRALKPFGIKPSDKTLEPVYGPLSMKAAEDVFAAIGEGTVQSRQIVALLFPDRHADTDGRHDFDEIHLTPSVEDDLSMPIGELPSGVAIQFAKCCAPVPGERIVGVVRTGKGITIHAVDCPKLDELGDAKERTLPLSWRTCDTAGASIARIRTFVLHQPGVLGSLSTVIGKQDGNIADVRFGQRSPELVELLFDVEVRDLDHLQRILASLRAAECVESAERIRS